MKKLNLWLLASLFVAAFTLTACSSSDSTSDGPGGSTPPPVDLGSLKYAKLSGIVTDGDTPLSGVTVTSGGVVVTTGLNGTFTLDQVKEVNGRAIVKFEKSGYMSLTRSFPTSDETHLSVSLTSFGEVRSFSTSSNGISTQVRDPNWNKSVTLKLPGGSYKNGNTAYTGQVTASAVYLNPEQTETFASRMPGDLTTDEDEQLVSLGMVAVDLKGANGEQLELPDGKTATLAFPVPSNAKQTPATMPLWSFDETTGLWVEEGVATLNADGTAYVGEVSHFSWHNLDYPEARATLNVKVVDPDGNPIANLPVDFDGQREMVTNNNGIASCIVPSNTKMYVTVASGDYGNYAIDYSTDERGNYDANRIVKKEVTLAPQESKTVELKMPCRAPIISGTVTNTGSGSKVCTLFVSYGMMRKTTPVVSDLEGKFWLYAPAGYKGSAKLIALFGDGTQAVEEFEIDGSNKTVNISVSNDSGANGGIFQISGSGMKFNYVLKNALHGSSYLRESTLGITLTDRDETKEFDHMTGSFHYLSITIPNYDSSKSSFDNVELSFGTEGHGAGRVSMSITGTLKMNKNGSNYAFKMSGAKGTIQEDQDRNIQWPGVDVTVDAEFSGTVTAE